MTLRSPFSAGFTGRAADALAAQMMVLSEPNRLKILALLHSDGELTVSEVTAKVPLAQPTVSHHVRILAEAGLVTKRKQGPLVFCKLDARAVADIASALNPWAAS